MTQCSAHVSRGTIPPCSKHEHLNTSVVLIIFNRPQLVRQVWATIRAARPHRLFVVADGPRTEHPEDAALCAECRAIVADVDWPCQVERNYADNNLNCGLRVATGLDWVFAQTDEAIVLEDDILPDPSFFGFCQTLLDRYRNERKRLGHNAQEFARRTFAPERAVRQLAELFSGLMARPKRLRAWPDDATDPAAWFIAALGDHAGPFAVSYGGAPGSARDAAEAEIGAASELLHSEGGIIHSRNRWLDDPYLRYWTGLALARRGDTARAADEFQAAAVRPCRPV